MIKRMFVTAVVITMLAASSAFAAVTDGNAALKPASPKPGSYDYLVLALSWAPTFCASSGGHADREECGGTNKYGFVAHGLWPVFPRGSGSAAHGCGGGESSLTDKSVEKMQGIMPSRKLINHEWDKHGTCFGSDATAYFGKIKTAWDKVKVPSKFKSPSQESKASADQIRKAFVEANPSIPANAIVVTCQKPRGKSASADRPLTFKEVRLCLDKDLNFKACGSQHRDRCAGDALIPPIR